MKSAAFTLVELLVVLSISGIVMGIGFAGFRQYSQRQVLIAAAREVRGDLRLLQEKAISGEKTCTGRLDGYRFAILSGNTQYSMTELCSGIGYNNKNKSIASGFTITATQEPILFKVLGQGTDIDIQVSPSSTITLTQTATGKTIPITVSANGSIE